MAKLALINGIPRMTAESASPVIYDETYTAGPGGVTTGTPVTLPSSATYEGLELEVWWNGQRLEDVADYSYVGSIPRTQVSFTFDLLQGDAIRFRIDRSA